MGLYDNFSLSKQRFVPTYAGAPVEEAKFLGQALEKKYEQGMAGVSAYNVMRDQAQVLDADQNVKNRVFDEGQSYLQEYVENGDLENATGAVIKASSIVSGNKDLKKAMSDRIKVTDHIESLEKARDSGAIKGWQFDRAMAKINNYQGVANNDDVKNHLVSPTVKADIEADIRRNIKDVRKQYRRDVVTDVDGVNKIRDVAYYDPKELQTTIAATMSLPQNQEYFEEMKDHFGEDAANQMLAGYAESAVNAMETEKPTFKDVSEGSKYGAGANAGGAQTSYEYLPIQEDSSGSMVKVGGDLELGESKSVAERNAIYNTNAERSATGSWWDKVAAGGSNWWHDAISNEELETYGKLSQAAQETYMPKEEFDALDEKGQEELVQRYQTEENNKRSNLAIETFNPMAEWERNPSIAKKTNDPEATKQSYTNHLKDNFGSKAFMDMSAGGKVVTSENDDRLKAAFSGDDDYKVEIIGNADARNPFVKENADFVDSQVMLLTEKGEEPRYYLVPVSAGQKNADSGRFDFKVSNQRYNQTRADLFNAFPTRNYHNTIEKGIVSIDGKRNGNDGINTTSISVGGNELTPDQSAKLAAGLGVDYNKENNEIIGLSEEMLANFIHRMNKQ